MTEDNYMTLVTSTDKSVTVPSHIWSHIVGLSQVTYWTKIALIILFTALGVELFLGIFANHSLIFSCAMFLIAGFAAIAVHTAALLTSAISILVIGLDDIAGWYGSKAYPNIQFLAIVWIGAACAISTGLFWLFAICCCLPGYHSKFTT
jgi:hypothetical protein